MSPLTGEVIDRAGEDLKAAFERLWPMGKFPVLRDEARGATVPESSLIVEYLDRVHPGPPLVPADPDEAMRVHLWDRFFDHYVESPLQKAVGDNFRPDSARDPHGVGEAKALLRRSWDLLEAELTDGRPWASGESFTLADCGAGPALFYANIVEPFAGQPNVEAYYARLLERPSFARAVDEARPYRAFFPLPWPESYA